MELAIPILALGGLYVASNQGKEHKKSSRHRNENRIENFTSMGATRNYLPNTNTPPQNYPVSNVSELTDTVQKYVNPNVARDLTGVASVTVEVNSTPPSVRGNRLVNATSKNPLEELFNITREPSE